MARSRRLSFQKPPRSNAPDPLAHLEHVQPLYFFAPDLEVEINKLDGVISSRVLSTGAQIEEIHIFASPERTPKKIVRDIESLLLVRFGLRIDHRKVSVVQLRRDDELTPAPARPRISKIEKKTTEEGEIVCIEIRTEAGITSGYGHARPGETDLHASSRALIDAIDHLLNTRGALALYGISQMPLSDWQIVSAVLRWTLGGHEEILVGACLAHGDPLEDAARATFDAVNRKLVLVQEMLS